MGKSANTLSCFLFMVMAVSWVSCGKDNHDTPDNGGPIPVFSFTELVTSADTIRAGYESAKIVAVASGHQLQFYWSSSVGTIAGSGSEVDFFTSFCVRGNVTITCRVEDKRGDTETKQIHIFIR